jgi:hypothetical protein
MKGSAIVFVLVTAISCGGPAANGPASATASASAAATGVGRPAVVSGGAPSFRQILANARVAEYKIVYKLSSTNNLDTVTGEQAWFFKPPKARFDFTSTLQGQSGSVSLYVLGDSTYMCFKESGQSTCLGMSAASVALQQNTAAMVQESIIESPDKFDGVLVETRQIAGQQAHCYDVRALGQSAVPLTEGRFCYSTQGIPLLQRFKTPGAEYSLEATILSLSVPDSDFTLPAVPTTLGHP